MIDQAAAAKIVTDYLAARSRAHRLVGRDRTTVWRPFGCVFFYTADEFSKSGDFKHALFGNAPLIFYRADSSIHVTGTAEPVEHYIQQFEKHRRTVLLGASG